jgi:hypothetical protein
MLLTLLRTTSSGAVTGTLAATETSADTAALSGKVIVQGTVAVSETGSDTATLSGTVKIQGTLSASGYRSSFWNR